LNKLSSESRDAAGPLVSIVTPSYNQAQFIEKTIRSVLLQDYTNLEYYVLDAMSADGTEQILDKYSGAITKAIRAKDDGQADAINKGFKLCSGEIMAYINSDDCYATPHVVSRVVELFREHPDVDVIYGKREYIDEPGYFVLNYPFREFDGPRLLEACYLPQECAFWRRSLFERAGNICDPTFKFAMDYDLWLRFLQAKGKFLAVDEYFGLFRWYPGQKSNDVWVKHGLPEIGRLQEQHLGRAMPEDEMTASYQEYWYGVHRLRNMRTFSQSVRVWNTFMNNKKEMLSSLPRDAWVFMNHLDIPDRTGIVGHAKTFAGSRSEQQMGAPSDSKPSSVVSTSRASAHDPNLVQDQQQQKPIEILQKREVTFDDFRAGVDKFALFASGYYLDQLSSPVDDPLKHFFEIGWKQNLDPHPFFNTSFYLETNKAALADGTHPLAHWFSQGATEGLDPHPLFNLEYYEKQCGAKGERATLIKHFHELGSKQGLSPHPLFDPFYFKMQLVNFNETNVFEHFLKCDDIDLNPHPAFLTRYYLETSLLKNVKPAEALIDYSRRGWKLGLNPYPLFDVRHYAKFYNDSEPLSHYLQEGYRKGFDPHPLFDTAHYVLQRPSLKDGYMSPLVHYITRGLNYGVSPHKAFDLAFFEQCEPENLKDLKVPALVRYLKNPYAPGVDPNSDFDTDFYCSRNPGLKESGVNPLAHYLAQSIDAVVPCTPFYNATFNQSERDRFIAACKGKVVWNFVERSLHSERGADRHPGSKSGLSMDTDIPSFAEFEKNLEFGFAADTIGDITLVCVTPTRHKYRTSSHKSRGLVFTVKDGKEILSLCFNPTRQLTEIQNLFKDTRCIKLLLQNFLSADRDLRDFLESLRQPFSTYLCGHSNVISQKSSSDRDLVQHLVDIQNQTSLGDGAEFRPLTLFNWVASRTWFLDNSETVHADTNDWIDFSRQHFPGVRVVLESLTSAISNLKPIALRKPIPPDSDSAGRSTRRIRVGIPCLPGSGWTGGIHYLNGLIAAAAAESSNCAVDFILIGKKNSDWQTFASLLHGWKEVVEVTELSNAWELDDLNLNCIFAAGGLLAQCKTPIISWLYDFQHFELPDFFSKNDIADRNLLFDGAMKMSAKIILSSEHARDVCNQLYPNHASKTSVLSFVPTLPGSVFTMDSAYVKTKYNLPETFFYLPNQFWVHKNHDVVIRALKHAKDLGHNVTVVCTGSTFDSRDDMHFARLLEQMAVNGLIANMLVLGLVPRADVFALMKECRSIIQPSLYEGWSTSVEESKCLDLSIILSNIPVHLEQNPAKGKFFSPFDPEGLAQLLIEQHATKILHVDSGTTSEKNTALAFRRFGAEFREIVQSFAFSDSFVK
jgi:glycosyltransferase involved in cell wall biosynthesis